VVLEHLPSRDGDKTTAERDDNRGNGAIAPAGSSRISDVIQTLHLPHLRAMITIQRGNIGGFLPLPNAGLTTALLKNYRYHRPAAWTPPLNNKKASMTTSPAGTHLLRRTNDTPTYLTL